MDDRESLSVRLAWRRGNECGWCCSQVWQLSGSRCSPGAVGSKHSEGHYVLCMCSLAQHEIIALTTQ